MIKMIQPGDAIEGDHDIEWAHSVFTFSWRSLEPLCLLQILPSSQPASLCCPGSPPPPLPNLPPLPLSSSPERRRLHPAKSATPNSPKVPPTPPQCTTPLPPTPQEKIPPIHLRGMNPTSTCTWLPTQQLFWRPFSFHFSSAAAIIHTQKFNIQPFVPGKVQNNQTVFEHRIFFERQLE